MNVSKGGFGMGRNPTSKATDHAKVSRLPGPSRAGDYAGVRHRRCSDPLKTHAPPRLLRRLDGVVVGDGGGVGGLVPNVAEEGTVTQQFA